MATAILFICLCLMIPNESRSQKRMSRHYGGADGLVCNTIYSILQDEQQFIWVSTDNGVYRFDGQVFQRFSTANGLPDNDILGMAEDLSGRLWLSCYNAHLCYIQHQKIFTSQNDPDLAKLKTRSYLRFITQRKDHVIFKEDVQPDLYRIDAGGKISAMNLKGDLILLQDYYLIRYLDEILLYNFQLKLLDRIKVSSRKDILAYVSENRFIISSNGQASLFDINHQQIQTRSKQALTISIENRYYAQGKLWIETQPGILTAFDKDLQPHSELALSVGNVTINSLFCDAQGGYWIGTQGDGLIYFPPHAIKILNEDEGLLQNNIACSFSSGNELYVVTGNSIVQKIDASGVSHRPIDLSQKCPGRINNMIVTENEIICGSDRGYLAVIPKSGGRVEVTRKVSSIKDMEYLGHQQILMATSSGTVKYDLKKHVVSNLNQGRTTAIHHVDDGIILTGGLKGLQRMFPFSGITDSKKFSANYFRDSTLATATITDIAHRNDLLIVTTTQQGVFLIDEKHTTHLNIAQGLTDNNCRKIALHPDGRIWITTASGINVIKIEDKTQKINIETITTFNGLTSNNIRAVHFIDSLVYASSSAGVMIFPANWFQTSKDTPLVYISAIQCEGKGLAFENPDHHFPSDSNSFEFTFSALDYSSMGHIKYAYRILGLSESWVKTNDKTIRIDRLKPGSYTLEVKAMNARKVWSRTPVRYSFSITPAWHEKTGIRILLGILLGLMIYFGTLYIYRRRFRKKVSEEAMKKHVAEVELKALKAQINPHFIFNTLNAIQFFINANENEKADLYLNKMSRLIRATLDFSNDISIPLREEIEYLKNYLDLETLRFDNDFMYQISIAETMDTSKLMIPAMVLQPHIENAIRHGLKPKTTGNKTLFIRFRQDNYFLYVEVEDNGIGRRASNLMKQNTSVKHISQGEELSQSKLDIYRKLSGKDVDLNIQDQYDHDQATGTLVTLKIAL
ncbi:MAG: histidine kinase [Chitinophagaceae bacterium]|nr:histidine kinase [Chitinophagaceae bacterium]